MSNETINPPGGNRNRKRDSILATVELLKKESVLLKGFPKGLLTPSERAAFILAVEHGHELLYVLQIMNRVGLAIPEGTNTQTRIRILIVSAAKKILPKLAQPERENLIRKIREALGQR
ncbi:hypothetical protein A3I95_00210 [Candidatus Nomurabacteria bacterium RIFCSPLOWO2_02_FULL_44_12]|nr:MAG: hypothetical protein A3E95_03165 [Candidatus Nomurabacteria bacterium RIFCSPHIGHO2_12_FULL_44_22b]OGJ07859.1 MAG: hypothetical protein A3I95_00210 [Candidatus Nomurabacteria bacterium RIFCSPLOWO2_02_FULL_44_12]